MNSPETSGEGHPELSESHEDDSVDETATVNSQSTGSKDIDVQYDSAQRPLQTVESAQQSLLTPDAIEDRRTVDVPTVRIDVDTKRPGPVHLVGGVGRRDQQLGGHAPHARVVP